MIYGIGIDIENISNIKKMYDDNKDRFLKKVFNDDEIIFFNSKKNPYQSICANFCAKEAISKAIGTGFREISLHDMSILRDDSGKPYVIISEELTEKFQKNIGYSFNIHVSLTHTKDIAAAYVIIETE